MTRGEQRRFASVPNSRLARLGKGSPRQPELHPQAVRGQLGGFVFIMRYLKTSEAAALLSVTPSTLRAWERRFGFPRPQRSPGGHRFYTLR